MCVIMIATKTRPTEEMIEKAWRQNSDGAGIAWREGDHVVWEKGIMQLDKIKALCARVPLQYVAHFRVASVGGVKESLTHPFLVGLEAKLDLKGRTKGAVLFHNGHWGAWNDKVLEAAIHSNNKLPVGADWSDSRAMAYLVSIYGPGLMDVLTGQKGVLMAPEGLKIFTGQSGWDKINDVWCSNDYFWSRTGGFHRGAENNNNHYRTMCSVGRCTKPRQEGKTMCTDCETEIEAKKAVKTDTSVGQSQVEIVTGAKGRGPLAKTFTMAEVEAYYKAKVISKSAMKKYRKAHESCLEPGNKGIRANKQLVELSASIAERLMSQVG